MSYKPVFVGDTALRDELDRISAAFDALVNLKMEKLYVAPEKPVFGQIAVPDGAGWESPLEQVRRFQSGSTAQPGWRCERSRLRFGPS